MHVRPEATSAASGADVSVVSKPFRGVVRDILRSVYRRATAVPWKAEGRWHQVIRSTITPTKDLVALATRNPGIVCLGEFNKNTVPKAGLREYAEARKTP